MNQLARYRLFAVAVVTAFMVIGSAVPAVQAQPLDCWEEETETVTVIDPRTGQPVTVERTVENYNENCNTINDGRENANDRAAEAAIYCTDYGVDVYDLGISGEGTFAFRATWNEINRVPEKPAENTLIDGVPGFALYRLTSGELQLNGPADWEGKPYVFIWDGCKRPNN